VARLVVWLKQWIANVVALIFLATLLEMLMPRGNMQRFARVVMGMLVILAVLQPVFSLLAKGMQLDGLAAAVSGPTLDMDSILAQAQRVRGTNDALALERTRAQLEQQIVARLSQLAGVAAVSCRAELVSDQTRQDYGAVTQVTIRVTPGTPTASSGVDPVTPVVIGASGTSGAGPGTGATATLAPDLRSDILRILATDYGLTGEQVSLTAGGS
jgi:stage III sporulation protein AF